MKKLTVLLAAAAFVGSITVASALTVPVQSGLSSGSDIQLVAEKKKDKDKAEKKDKKDKK